jgi:hypothetical protein
MRRRSLLGLVTLLLLAASAPADEIAWKFKEGDVFFALETVEMKMEMSFLGNTQPMESKTAVVSKMTVKKTNPDGSVVLERRIEQQKTEASMPMPFDVDELDKKMEGATFTITLSPKFELTKIEGYADFIKRLVGDDEIVGPFIKASLTEDTIKRSLEELFLFVPGKAVSAGDKWERKSKVPMGPMGTLLLQTNYQYDGKDGGLDKISYESALKYEAPKDTEANPAMPFKLVKGDMKAEKAKGVIKFDSAKGRMAENQGTVNLDMKLTMDVNGQEIEMELRQEQKSTYKVSDARPKD